MVGKTALMMGDLNTAGRRLAGSATSGICSPICPAAYFMSTTPKLRSSSPTFRRNAPSIMSSRTSSPGSDLPAAASLPRSWSGSTGYRRAAHLELARSYMDSRCPPLSASSKSPRSARRDGARRFFTNDREGTFRDFTCRVADFFVADQQADGVAGQRAVWPGGTSTSWSPLSSS